MNSKIYRQADSRWGRLPYKNKSSVGGSGCGLCAVLHCIIERDKYKNYTPKSIHSYMRQFAVDGQGTLWSGIPTALKHYGLTGVKELGTMPELWAEMNKDGRVAVLLMKKGRCKSGRVWTTTAHFVTALDYKYQNKKHYLYFKDSSNRKNDGWIAYETDFINHVAKIWVGTIPTEEKKPATKKAYSGEFPTIEVTKKSNEECIDSIVNWAVKIANDNTYGYKKWTSNKKTHQCPICHKGSGNGWNCIGFVSACFYHGGKVKSVACNCSGIVSGGGTYKDWTLAKFKARNGNDWTEVKSWKKGDVIVCFDKKTEKYKHTALGYKEGYVVDATSKRSITVRKTTLPSYKVRIFRYTGHQKSIKTVKALAIEDSRKAEVKKLQSFLNWFGGYKLVVDGEFGNKTLEAVKKFQKAQGLSVDGKFGSKSLEKAKAVKK